MSSVNVRHDGEVEQPEEHGSVSSEGDNCPECGGDLISDEEHGETLCEECGLVVEGEEIDRGPEWRSFDDGADDEKSRVGAPTTKLMHDQGLSSEIGWSDQDARGNTLGPRRWKKMQRLRTWDERFRTKDSKERNLKQALGEIERMGSALGLPEDIREMAAVIYRRALEETYCPVDPSRASPPRPSTPPPDRPERPGAWTRWTT